LRRLVLKDKSQGSVHRRGIDRMVVVQYEQEVPGDGGYFIKQGG
jgi:hypothetical protein